MKLDVFVYIPSEKVREFVYAILAKKGWHWYGNLALYDYNPEVPFYLYMPEADRPRLSWCPNPYNAYGRYTQIEINEFISEWEEDYGTD